MLQCYNLIKHTSSNKLQDTGIHFFIWRKSENEIAWTHYENKKNKETVLPNGKNTKLLIKRSGFPLKRKSLHSLGTCDLLGLFDFHKNRAFSFITIFSWGKQEIPWPVLWSTLDYLSVFVTYKEEIKSIPQVSSSKLTQILIGRCK